MLVFLLHAVTVQPPARPQPLYIPCAKSMIACAECRAVCGSLLPSPWESGDRTWRQPAKLQSTSDGVALQRRGPSFAMGTEEPGPHYDYLLSMADGHSLHLLKRHFPQ